MASEIRQRYGSHSFGHVLVLTVATVVFTIAAPVEDWAKVVAMLLASATLVTAVWTSGASRRAVIIALIAAGLAVGAAVVSIASSQDVSAGVNAFVTACLVGVAPVVIIRALVRVPDVTVRTLLGALAVYLLIGLFFATAYAVVGAIDDNPFFTSTNSETGSDYVYFSFVTMATVGYGDLVAAGDLGRSMAVLEGVLGQMYLVTVVAVVVTNLGRRRPTERL
jgi:voltage-gated potassium channel